MSAKRQTKAEREAAERAAHEKALHAALAWPDDPAPEPYTPEMVDALAGPFGSAQAVVRAWTYNAYTCRVTRGAFDRISHTTEGDRPRSQRQGGPWFYTEAEAHLAMRWAVCRRMAGELLRIIESTPARSTRSAE